MFPERKNLWAPWRYKYITALEKKQGCFLCEHVNSPAEKDQDNLVLWRTARCIVVFNRFPYNNGHLLIAPQKHVGDLSGLEETTLLELIKIVRDSQNLLKEALSPDGFNIGANFGRCAGAGLPEHMHIHVVPRWNGDTNYMHVCADTDVISQSVTELSEQLRRISARKNLPSL